MNRWNRQPDTSHRPPRGSVLIVVIWIVLILASLVIVLAHAVRVEAVAANNHLAQVQAEAVAEGAIQSICAYLAGQGDTDSYSSNQFEAMKVGDGYFWVLQPDLTGGKEHAFGLVDEAGKINLNSEAPQQLLEMLLKLPNMTAELANSIIDWQDADDDISEGGAEAEYYLLLKDPYQCKNAPLETIEEVLLIKGADQTMLFGEDTNRNGVLDWNENDGSRSAPADNSNGRLDPGFFNYVTIHSYEMNLDSQGQPRINLTQPQSQAAVMELIQEILGEQEAITVMQSLRNAGFFKNQSNLTLFDAYYASGMEYEAFSKIIDRLTTDNNQQKIFGRINVNTAAEAVLLCLPGLEQSDVDDLIKKREKRSEDDTSTLWVTEVLDADKARGIARYITAQSSQFSADVVAASGDGRAFARYYVVIDMASGTPEILYKQSLHGTGWPLDADLLETLRSGQTL